MMKRFLVLLSLLILPVYAGSYEDALKKNDFVFLYLYGPDCKVCREFDSVYNQLQKNNKDFAYIKVNANTSYGYYLMIKYRGKYVPYIILTNKKTNQSVNVNHSCIMNEICLMRAMKSFKG